MEIPKGQSESVYRRRTDNTMANRKSNTAIYKAYIYNYRSSNTNLTNISAGYLFSDHCEALVVREKILHYISVIPIKTAIPMVMGANIGTSVTNTIVSMAQAGDREEFRKAFGGATVHDMFNWLTVIILLPIETACHYLYHLTGAIVANMNFSKSSKKKDMLKVITKPFTSLIVKVRRALL